MNPALQRERARAARARAALAAPTIDIVVKSAAWTGHRDARRVLRRAIVAAATAVPERTGELAVVLTDDAEIRILNRTWRGKDAPTNVLSFPAASPSGAPHLLGDIVIAYETTAREALAECKPFGHHLAHLAVHGFLHLAGFDHEVDAEAEAMERLEITVLAGLKVPNPYIARERKG